MKSSNPSSHLPYNHLLPSHHAEILTPFPKVFFPPKKAAVSPSGSGGEVQRGGSRPHMATLVLGGFLFRSGGRSGWV